MYSEYCQIFNGTMALIVINFLNVVFSSVASQNVCNFESLWLKIFSSWAQLLAVYF